MQIRLLAEGYTTSERLYLDFMNDSLDESADYYSEKFVTLEEAPDFPIYMRYGSPEGKSQAFHQAIHTIMDSYIDTPRDVHMSGRFWHSLLMTKRDYLLDLYAEYIDSSRDFKNVILKPFDWESYIYKCVLAAEYISDEVSADEEEKDYYIDLIVDNLDMYNYIIKYALFRNSQFVLNYFRAVDELGLTAVMKAQVKDRPELGKDPRYGRLVFETLNNNYPVVMAPFLELEDLKEEIVTALSVYYDLSDLEKPQESPEKESSLSFLDRFFARE